MKGYYAEQQLASNTFDLENYSDLERDVCKEKLAEDQICNYVDTIMTAENPSPPCDGEWDSPDIHPCQKKVQDLKECELRHDYCDLVICNSGYCLRNSSDSTQYCRFKFSFKLRQNTHIEHEKVNSKNGVNSVRPTVVLKRDDSGVNKHQRLQLQAWRANVDIQPIIDYAACLEYIVKYASKAEKMSSVVQNAFTSIVQNLQGTEYVKKVIRKLAINSAGERDFSAQEVCIILCL